MLQHRLLFGTLMTALFIAVAVFDGWLDGSLTAGDGDDKRVQGTFLYVLVCVLILLAQHEFRRLARAKKLKIFYPVCGVACILLAGTRYWLQLFEVPAAVYLFFLFAFSTMGLVLFQYIRYGTSGVMANCGVNSFSIVYLGILSGFVIAVRIEFGLWPVLMFVFAVKSADIGAYAWGTLFGKHKFAPGISPGKTWEGMAGALVTAAAVSILFAASCDIMVWWLAGAFGCCAAITGQMGDLVESMIKRDAEQKDSAATVPGFGGILDIVDSPLVAAPFAYLFFVFALGRPIC
ncbi:MAG: phosphatidate cytidylyltransferase [Phycisphaerales bacterium]|nr:MAG: phosphatidate cytidylyltransferase [Phycisphaerales bacterium]